MTSSVGVRQIGGFPVVAEASLFRLVTWLPSLLAVLVLICAIALAAGNLLCTGFAFEKNYNEGWNVYNAQRLIDHELIYDDNYWRMNDYPILSFFAAATVNIFVNNLLLSGRIIALVSFLAIGVLAGAAIRRFGGDRVAAVFGASCALGFCYLIAPAWVAADDPQTLGEAMMLGGLVSYVSRPPDRFNLLRTALLVTGGAFVKHNVIAIPLAVTFDIAIRAPRRLPVWLGCCAALVVTGLGLTYLVGGGAFIDHLLSPRTFTWHSARYHFAKYLRFGEFPLAVVLLFARAVFSPNRRVLGAYGVISIATGTIFAGFEGASYNMFQDAAVFIGIAVGAAFCELCKRITFRASVSECMAGVVLGVAPLLLAQPILARSPQAIAQIYHAGKLLEADRRAEQSFLAEAQYITDQHGPAICESLLLCYYAGQPFILDPFNSRQLILARRLDESELIQRIAAKEFAVVQLRADICDDPKTASCHILHHWRKFSRFTDNVLYAVDHYYRIGWRSRDGTFYVPR